MSNGPATTTASTKLVVHELDKTAAFYREAYGFGQTGSTNARRSPEFCPEASPSPGGVRVARRGKTGDSNG